MKRFKTMWNAMAILLIVALLAAAFPSAPRTLGLTFLILSARMVSLPIHLSHGLCPKPRFQNITPDISFLEVGCGNCWSL